MSRHSRCGLSVSGEEGARFVVAGERCAAVLDLDASHPPDAVANRRRECVGRGLDPPPVIAFADDALPPRCMRNGFVAYRLRRELAQVGKPYPPVSTLGPGRQERAASLPDPNQL